MLICVLQDNYQDLPGSLLEGIATLLQQNVRLSVCPMDAADLEQEQWIVCADDLHPEEPLDQLYQYLLGSGFVVPLRAGAAAQH